MSTRRSFLKAMMATTILVGAFRDLAPAPVGRAFMPDPRVGELIGTVDGKHFTIGAAGDFQTISAWEAATRV